MGHADWIRDEWPKAPRVVRWVRKAHHEIHRPRTAGPVIAQLSWNELEAVAPAGREGERAYLHRVHDSLIDGCHQLAGATAVAPHVYDWLRRTPDLNDAVVPPGLGLAGAVDPGRPAGLGASAMQEGLHGVASAFTRGAQRVHRQRHWGGPEGRALRVADVTSESFTLSVRPDQRRIIVLETEVVVTRTPGLVVAAAPEWDLRREATVEHRALADIAEALAVQLSQAGSLTVAHEEDVRRIGRLAAYLDAAA